MFYVNEKSEQRTKINTYGEEINNDLTNVISS